MHAHVVSEDALSCTNPWLICHQVNAEPVESYQPMCFHPSYYYLNEAARLEVEEGKQAFTLSRVVFVGSSLVLHSTCWYK